MEKLRGRYAGIFILTAYFVLASAITDNRLVVMVFEVASGLSVIGIAWLFYPLLKKDNKGLSKTYYLIKWIEGSIRPFLGFSCWFVYKAFVE